MQSYRANYDTEGTDELPPLAACVGTLQEAAQVALADQGVGDPVFKFARAVKAFEVTVARKLPAKELRCAFAVWWAAAKDSLPTGSDFEEYQFAFLDAFDRAKTPLGANVVEAALRRLGETPSPPEAQRYSSPKLKRLVHFCHELQMLAGDGAFFLSTRVAARVVEIKRYELVSAFLNGLVRDGILTVVSKGTPGGRRATRYRFNSSARSEPLQAA